MNKEREFKEVIDNGGNMHKACKDCGARLPMNIVGRYENPKQLAWLKMHTCKDEADSQGYMLSPPPLGFYDFLGPNNDFYRGCLRCGMIYKEGENFDYCRFSRCDFKVSAKDSLDKYKTTLFANHVGLYPPELNIYGPVDRNLVEPRKDTCMEIEVPSRFEQLQGQRFNDGKLMYDLIPELAMEEMAKLYTFGANKYSARNWEQGLVFMETIAAIRRHIKEFVKGEDIDKESGCHHMASAAFGCLALVEFYYTHKGTDNRPYKKGKQ